MTVIDATSTSVIKPVALVTGASRGLGESILIDLARQGYTAIGTATSSQGAAKITQSIRTVGGKGLGLVMNVVDSESVAAAHAEILAQFGAPLVLVNNAGITRDNIMLRMKDNEWDEVVATNLTAIYRLTRLMLKPMIKARWGRIINIGSVVGSTGNPGQANYAAAKAGMIGFSKALAQEVGIRNITVNVVSPGFIDTDMTRALSEAQREALLKIIPLQRFGKPEEIADAVTFLVSEKANYITGQTLHVNGGMYM